MKTSTLLKTIFIIGCLLFSNVISAQEVTKSSRKLYERELEAFEKLANDPKTLNKISLTSGGIAANYEKKYNLKNNYCIAEDYTVPKKVLLLSYSVEDKSHSSTSYTDWTRTTTTTKASDKKISTLAQLIYDQSIGSIKEKYAQLGIELVTPEEFFITEKQKAAYFAARPIAEAKARENRQQDATTAVPDGYRAETTSYMGFTGVNYYVERDLYLKSLNIDAFLNITVYVSSSEEAQSLSNINASFTFHNPGYFSSDKIGQYAVGYTPYTGASVDMKLNPAWKGIFIKKEEEFTNKKGKTDIKYTPTAINPNLSIFVSYVAEKVAKNAQKQIPIKEKKKKK